MDGATPLYAASMMGQAEAVAMLVGAGVAGGQVLGAYNGDTFAGEPISLATGEVSAHGESLVPGHLGATLMTMADIDPAEFVSESPIEAAIR